MARAHGPMDPHALESQEGMAPVVVLFHLDNNREQHPATMDTAHRAHMWRAR